MSLSSRCSLGSLSSLLTSAAVFSALAFAPGCSSGDVPIGQDGTNTRDGNGPGSGGDSGATSTDGGSGGTDASEPVSCTTDSDCTGGDHCGFLVADACTAVGQCLPQSLLPNCGALIANCACDGTTVYTGCTDLPQGYASKPVATQDAACGASDGGGLPTTCVTSADCGANAACGYKETDGCAATGTCFAVPFGGTACQSIVPACGCDGNPVNTVCNGLPDGYTLAPVVSPAESTCSTDGG